MAEREIHIQESVTSPDVDKVKPAPKQSTIPVPFFYASSDDGTDENLLILLHGLGAYSFKSPKNMHPTLFIS
jgi:hypothetical protein